MTPATPQKSRFKTDRQLYFPHCLMLDLETRPHLKETLSLSGEINFSLGWYDLEKRRYAFFTKDWRVQFAIRSGELVFILKGVTAPLKARKFIQTLPVNVKIKQQKTFGLSESSVAKLSTKRVAKDSASLKMATSPEAVLSAEHSSENSHEASTTHEEKAAVSEEDSEFSVITVHTTGEENAPIWTFESRLLKGYLLGLFNYKLADLYPSSGEILIRAEFKTSAPAIFIKKIDSIEYLEMPDGKKMAVKAQLRKLLYEKILEKKCLAWCAMYQE